MLQQLYLQTMAVTFLPGRLYNTAHARRFLHCRFLSTSFPLCGPPRFRLTCLKPRYHGGIMQA
jgi:hypothetical protein